MYTSLVLVQPRKTRPCITERLLMGRKESNQTNKHFFIPLLTSADFFQNKFFFQKFFQEHYYSV